MLTCGFDDSKQWCIEIIVYHHSCTGREGKELGSRSSNGCYIVFYRDVDSCDTLLVDIRLDLWKTFLKTFTPLAMPSSPLNSSLYLLTELRQSSWVTFFKAVANDSTFRSLKCPSDSPTPIQATLSPQYDWSNMNGHTICGTDARIADATVPLPPWCMIARQCGKSWACETCWVMQ